MIDNNKLQLVEDSLCSFLDNPTYLRLKELLAANLDAAYAEDRDYFYEAEELLQSFHQPYDDEQLTELEEWLAHDSSC